MGKIYEVKRGRNYIYYYRHSRRVKLDPAKPGKTKGSGPSRVITQNVYLGKAEDIVRKIRGEKFEHLD
jgi:hypothetical protein